MISNVFSQCKEVEVNPKPDFCSENSENSGNTSMCVGTSCAMDMRFWVEVNRMKDLSCEGYKNEFNNCPTSRGGVAALNPENIKAALQFVGEKNKTCKSDTTNCEDFSIKQFPVIREKLKYSEASDPKSPWDRPGVGVFYGGGLKRGLRSYSTGNEAHAVLVYGLKLDYVNNGKIEVTYIFHNPIWNSSSDGFFGQSTATFTLGGSERLPMFIFRSFIVFFWLETCAA